jgi:hypothetical protein
MRKQLIGIAALLSIAAAPAPLILGGVPVSQADIVDARALPKLGGGAALQITVEGASAKRLAAAKAVPVTVQLNGKTLCPPLPAAPFVDGLITLDCFGPASTDDVAAIAKQISGKNPLPDSLDDGP